MAITRPGRVLRSWEDGRRMLRPPPDHPRLEVDVFPPQFRQAEIRRPVPSATTRASLGNGWARFAAEGSRRTGRAIAKPLTYASRTGSVGTQPYWRRTSE